MKREISDIKLFKHGEEGTHYACDEMIKKHGGKTKCCGCNPEHKCKTNQEECGAVIQATIMGNITCANEKPCLRHQECQPTEKKQECNCKNNEVCQVFEGCFCKCHRQPMWQEKFDKLTTDIHCEKAVNKALLKYFISQVEKDVIEREADKWEKMCQHMMKEAIKLERQRIVELIEGMDTYCSCGGHLNLIKENVINKIN